MKLKKERYIPQGFTEYAPEIGEYPKDLFACYVNIEQPHNPRAMFFIGKRSGHDWYYRFPTIEQMKEKIKDSISRVMSWEDIKAERKKERKEQIWSVEVGDIFYNSWGYDQTNIDFYQCTEVKGKTFTIREIRGRYCGEAPSGSMSDYTIAVKDEFLPDAKPIKKRSLSMEFGCLTKTDDKTKHFCSWYA